MWAILVGVDSTLAYFLSVVIGLSGGGWALSSLYRRTPALGDKPPTARRTLATVVAVSGVGLGLAWIVSEWHGVYLAGVGAFAAVFVLGDFVWPRLRHGRNRGASA